MRRLAVLALVVACGRPAPPVAPIVQPVAAPATGPAPLPPPIVRSDPAAGGIATPHAGPIVLVAATPDATSMLGLAESRESGDAIHNHIRD